MEKYFLFYSKMNYLAYLVSTLFVNIRVYIFYFILATKSLPGWHWLPSWEIHIYLSRYAESLWLGKLNIDWVKVLPNPVNLSNINFQSCKLFQLIHSFVTDFNTYQTSIVYIIEIQFYLQNYVNVFCKIVVNLIIALQ